MILKNSNGGFRVRRLKSRSRSRSISSCRSPKSTGSVSPLIAPSPSSIINVSRDSIDYQFDYPITSSIKSTVAELDKLISDAGEGQNKRAGSDDDGLSVELRSLRDAEKMLRKDLECLKLLTPLTSSSSCYSSCSSSKNPVYEFGPMIIQHNMNAPSSPLLTHRAIDIASSPDSHQSSVRKSRYLSQTPPRGNKQKNKEHHHLDKKSVIKRRKASRKSYARRLQSKRRHIFSYDSVENGQYNGEESSSSSDNTDGAPYFNTRHDRRSKQGRKHRAPSVRTAESQKRADRHLKMARKDPSSRCLASEQEERTDYGGSRARRSRVVLFFMHMGLQDEDDANVDHLTLRTIFVSAMARLAFGRIEYKTASLLRPPHILRSSSDKTALVARKTYHRTYQGGLAVFFAAAMAVTACYGHVTRAVFCILLFLLPPLVTFVEIKSPHQFDETSIALSMLLVRLAIDYCI